MFFIISKLLSFFIEPLTLLILLVIKCFFVLQNQRKLTFYLRILFFYILFISNPGLVNLALKYWEIKPTENLKKNQYKSAIVLGGLSSYDFGIDRIIFNQNADRLLQALPLIHSENVEKIILSGGSGFVKDPAQRESVFLKSYLIKIGYPNTQIYIDSNSRNTHENAKFTKLILQQNRIIEHEHVLVTSASHMRRALACFKKNEIHVVPFSTNQGYNSKMETSEMLTPSIKAIQYWGVLLHEIVGYLTYKLANYI
jgi:uncharacterized SAM-binding protein YcdF (DUF218 family)